MSTIAVIDGDILAYVNSAATEERSIQAIHKESGKKKTFKHRTEFREFLKDKEKWQESDFDIVDQQKPEDISHTCMLIKRAIKDILEKCETDKYEIYLSGKNNFRDNLPLPVKYKSNRSETLRPLNLAAAKDYLSGIHNAKVVDFAEGDDKLSMRAWDGYKSKTKIIQCTTDKDSMGCMGWNLNWDKMDKPTLINGLGSLYLNDKNEVKGYGRIWMAFQWLNGDATDGYKPTHLCKSRFGEKSAYNLLKDCKTDQECWAAVYNQFTKWYPEPFEYQSWDGVTRLATVFDIMQMYLDCCRMLRWEGDKVDVYEVLKKMEII